MAHTKNRINFVGFYGFLELIKLCLSVSMAEEQFTANFGNFIDFLMDDNRPDYCESSHRTAESFDDPVLFRLYTPESRDNYELLDVSRAYHFQKTAFDPDRETKIIIHGWLSDPDSTMPNLIKNAYLSWRHDFNIIIVDWSITSKKDYAVARYLVSQVGLEVAYLIETLSEVYDILYESISMISHSMGCHVAGFAGKFIAPDKVAEIVALDPALPLFYLSKSKDRLASTDARYVVHHATNAGMLGYDLPLGHATIYYNFGQHQPGCERSRDLGCSHSRAVEYYAESINSDVGFWGRYCENFYSILLLKQCQPVGKEILVGGKMDRKGGILLVETNDVAPYAIRRKQL